MDRVSRIKWLLFAAVFWMSGGFYSGGGWNQNARFAQVRAMVEEGRFTIDHFLIYTPETGKPDLHRVFIQDATIVTPDRGSVASLCWRDSKGNLTPIRQPDLTSGGSRPLVALETLAASGDVAFAHGHFYPNKPPGVSLLAAPTYAVLLAVERFAGCNPDSWWILTVNSWITTAFSVGLATALGAVLLFQIASRYVRSNVALGVALAYAFGTMALPYGTMLFDQNITAAALLGAFALLLEARGTPRHTVTAAALAGICAGSAVVCNYIAAAVLVLFVVYAGKRLWVAFAAGAFGPLLFLAYYHTACFGAPLALSTTFQNPILIAPFTGATPLLLGMFSLPKPEIVFMLLVSPFRGLFFLSPILLLAAWGLWKWHSSGAKREALLCAGIFSLYFIVNASFACWHGGYGVAPRYLGPAIPFLALGLVTVWPKYPRLCGVAAACSIAIQWVLTATDPMSPVGTGSIARDSRPDWLYSPLMDYSVPLLVTGHAWPMLDSMGRDYVQQQELKLVARDLNRNSAESNWLREELHQAAERGDAFPLPLAAFSGPVSVNPMGICEGDYFQLFQPHSPQARWNACNIGEFLYPESLWSLVPMVVLSGGLAGMAGVLARVPKRKLTRPIRSLSGVAGYK